MTYEAVVCKIRGRPLKRRKGGVTGQRREVREEVTQPNTLNEKNKRQIPIQKPSQIQIQLNEKNKCQIQIQIPSQIQIQLNEKNKYQIQTITNTNTFTKINTKKHHKYEYKYRYTRRKEATQSYTINEKSKCKLES